PLADHERERRVVRAGNESAVRGEPASRLGDQPLFVEKPRSAGLFGERLGLDSVEAAPLIEDDDRAADLERVPLGDQPELAAPAHLAGIRIDGRGPAGHAVLGDNDEGVAAAVDLWSV